MKINKIVFFICGTQAKCDEYASFITKLKPRQLFRFFCRPWKSFRFGSTFEPRMPSSHRIRQVGYIDRSRIKIIKAFRLEQCHVQLCGNCESKARLEAPVPTPGRWQQRWRRPSRDASKNNTSSKPLDVVDLGAGGAAGRFAENITASARKKPMAKEWLEREAACTD